MDDKQFPPSKKKIEASRKKGQVLKARNISGSLALLLGLTTCYYTLIFNLDKAGKLVKYCLSNPVHNAYLCLAEGSQGAVVFLLICLGAASIGGIFLEYLQVGKLFEPSLLKVDLSRLSPLAWLRRIPENLLSLALKFVLMGFLLLIFVCYLSSVSAGSLWQLPQRIFFAGIGLLIISAGIEYLLARKKYFAELGMSFAELKQEQKESEGDPLTAALRKQKHRQILLADLERQVRQAKVIIVN